MTDYRCFYIPGSTWFFTVNLAEWQDNHRLVEHGRILWFQVAFALLDGASPAPFLGRLKTALQAEGAHMEWTMDPVLAHLQPKLSPAAQALLTALVAALGDPANRAKLDDFPEWRAATPLPLA